MKTNRRQRIILIISIISLTICSDQVSKTIIRNNLTNHEYIFLLNNSLVLIKAENFGAALGLGGNFPSILKTIYFQILPISVLLFFFRMILTKTAISKQTAIGLSAAIGGAVTNIFDRVFFGSVTDFIQIQMGTIQTGIFNIADIFIVTGTILVVLDLIFNKKNNLLDSL
tara:strand:- start:2370 stop:2879 length:510 start_codon:yes stop_codon:yes gene_type:complete